MKQIVEACQGAGFDPESAAASASAAAGASGVGSVVQLSMGYKTMLGLIEQLKSCAEVAATRTSNWQVYCQREKSESVCDGNPSMWTPSNQDILLNQDI